MRTPKLRTPLKPGWQRCPRCLTRFVRVHGITCCNNAYSRRHNGDGGSLLHDAVLAAAHEDRVSLYAARAAMGKPLFEEGQ